MGAPGLPPGVTTPDAAPSLRTTRADVRRRAERARSATGADAETDAETDAGADVATPPRVPVVGALTADPFDAYRRARGDEPAVFLETGGGRSGWGYFGVAPDAFVRVGGAGDGVWDAAIDGTGAVPATDSALDALAAIAEDGGGLARGDCELPFPGGWFGWCSYDVAREIEALPATATDDRGLPLLQFARYPTVAAWREPHDGETELLLASAPTLADGPDAAFERGRERIDALAERISTGHPALDPPPVDADVAAFESDCGRADYRERVRTAKAAIRDGETFQANLSHRLEAPAAVSPIAVYDALRRGNPAPYAGIVEFPGVDLVSASPELLLEVDGDDLLTEPIAGTRPRGEDPAADGALERELRTDEKERAEHAMLVDLERNDLGKVAAIGSVDVTEYRRVDRYAAVMHLVSRVRARRRPGTDLADAVRAVFPGGTITGAPKPRTMELIEALETTRRGPYTGSMGAIGFDDRAVFNIVIRTLVRTGDRYGLRVGAGIVHDSEPDAEYDETLAKARALLDAVEEALADRREPGAGPGEESGGGAAPSLEVSGE